MDRESGTQVEIDAQVIETCKRFLPGHSRGPFVDPREARYSRDFYAACRERLNPGGILVAQNANLSAQFDEIGTSAMRLAPLFADVAFYTAAVPACIGGAMAFARGQ